MFDNGTDPAKAAAVARRADIAIVFGTQWASEAMVAALSRDCDQDKVVTAVAGTGPDEPDLHTHRTGRLIWTPKSPPGL